jgi:hypothetical protein
MTNKVLATLTEQQWLGLTDLNNQPTQVAEFAKEFGIEDKYAAMFYFASQKDYLAEAIITAAIYEAVDYETAVRLNKHNINKRVLVQELYEIFVRILNFELSWLYHKKHDVIYRLNIETEYNTFYAFADKYFNIFNNKPKKDVMPIYQSMLSAITAIGNLKDIYLYKSKKISPKNYDIAQESFFASMLYHIDDLVKYFPQLFKEETNLSSIHHIAKSKYQETKIYLADLELKSNRTPLPFTEDELKVSVLKIKNTNAAVNPLLTELKKDIEKYQLGTCYYNEESGSWIIEISYSQYSHCGVVTKSEFNKIKKAVKKAIKIVLERNSIEFNKLNQSAKQLGLNITKPKEVLKQDIADLKEQILNTVRAKIENYNQELKALKLEPISINDNKKIFSHLILQKECDMFKDFSAFDELDHYINYIKTAIAKEQQIAKK